jgi:hypothetical protein
MITQPSDAILQLLDEWVATIPPADVDVMKERNPWGEYGPSTVIRFRPTRQRACNLDVLVLDDGSCGFFVDSWSRLAARCGLEYSRLGLASEDFVALFLEPSPLSGSLVLAVCKAVAAGEIHLEVGLILNRIVCTRGFLRTPSGPFRMHGVGGPMLISKILGRAGLGTVRRITYDPWLGRNRESVHPA